MKCSMKLSEPDMLATLVVGYGNPLRGDDGVGWRVVEKLVGVAKGAVTGLAVHQLTPELAEQISEADLVIFVDASYEGEPGTWRWLPIKLTSTAAQAVGHYFAPENLLNYVKAVYQAEPTALMISVPAGSFDCGESLTPAVAKAVEEIAGELARGSFEITASR
jgi:hydrogenase maturation protease